MIHINLSINSKITNNMTITNELRRPRRISHSFYTPYLYRIVIELNRSPAILLHTRPVTADKEREQSNENNRSQTKIGNEIFSKLKPETSSVIVHTSSCDDRELDWSNTPPHRGTAQSPKENRNFFSNAIVREKKVNQFEITKKIKKSTSV